MVIETKMRSMKSCLRAAIVFLIVVVASCSPASEPKTAVPPFPFNERIGWFHGPCLAISGPELARGTPVTLVIAAEPQKVQQARIQEKTDSPASCPALMEGRAAQNRKPGVAFFVLEGASVGPSDMGFGIVMPPATPAVVNGQAEIDLDQDGHKEVFTSCASSEGIKFAVWTEKPYQGEPRWSAYYYLDYDLTPTCP